MEISLSSINVFALLALGLGFGLKHATEVEHVVAVSTIVIEHRSVWGSAIGGGLWGAGHTASLVTVGCFVLVLRVTTPLPVADWLEFGMALMIIVLGVLAMTRVMRGRAALHIHRHVHRRGEEGHSHVHLHFHDRQTEHIVDSTFHLSKASAGSAASHSHTISRIGFKPILLGAMHGLAGSAALTLAGTVSIVFGLWYAYRLSAN